MKWTGTLLILLLASTFLSRAQSSPPQRPRSQMPDLGRPTTSKDQLPPFNFEHYFVGKWKFEWEMPDSPIGPGGLVTGTEIYKPGIDGRFFESEYEGKGPQGPFHGRAVVIYQPANKVISRYETDSRGFTLLESGTMGGDLGGYVTIYYESAPFTLNGKVLRMKTTTQLLSPEHYRMKAQLAVDGGPFASVGNPWWKRETPAAGER